MKTLNNLPFRAALAISAAAMAGGCVSGSSAVPAEYYNTTPLTRNAIEVEETTEFLELRIAPDDTQLTVADKARLEGFLLRYKRVGDGPLIMSLPAGGVNAQAAVRGVAEARQIAYETGVRYEDIVGGNYDGAGAYDAPIVLAFRSFNAKAPECVDFSSVDFADVSSNNELPNLGCSVRANMAAMLSEPQDLFGERSLGDTDIVRRTTQIEAYRAGESTSATRSGDESGKVSDIGD